LPSRVAESFFKAVGVAVHSFKIHFLLEEFSNMKLSAFFFCCLSLCVCVFFYV
jgi:hypothetical protein